MRPPTVMLFILNRQHSVHGHPSLKIPTSNKAQLVAQSAWETQSRRWKQATIREWEMHTNTRTSVHPQGHVQPAWCRISCFIAARQLHYNAYLNKHTAKQTCTRRLLSFSQRRNHRCFLTHGWGLSIYAYALLTPCALDSPSQSSL